MARTSFCDRVLLRAVSDAAFRLLPAVARLIFYEVLAFGNSSAERGRIRFLGSVSASVSRLVGVSETEAETGLETLASLGLLEVDTETNSVWLVGARANSARAEAARINGKKGGRPPKNRALDAGQQSLMLPIQGGRSETHGTEAEPKRESSRAVVTTTSLEEGSSTAREAPAWVSLGQEIAAIAALDGTNGGFDYRPVQGWLTAGRSREQILSAVRAVVSRPTYAGQRVHSLHFFSSAVEQQAQGSRAVSAETMEDRLAADAYSQAAQAWASNPTGKRPRREDFARRHAA